MYKKYEENKIIYNDKKTRKIFLDDLPRWEIGTNKGKVDWYKSIGYKVKFIYENIQGEIEIVEYISKGRYIFIKYKDKDVFKIKTDNFMKRKLGGLLKEKLYKNEYNENNSKRVDLRNLPLNSKGIDWNKVAEKKMKIPFVYEDIKGEVEVINYSKKEQELTIQYLDKNPFKIVTGSFQKCGIGKLLNKITDEFKIKIGARFYDNKRDLIITDREYIIDKNGCSRKWYKYHCNKCGWDEGWMTEYSLMTQKTGCSACCRNPRTPVLGINTIWDTDRWMCDLGISKEDAKKYTSRSGEKITPICPDCGKIKDKQISIGNIFYHHSIGCKFCGDGISYPEKLMSNILKQLNISFETEFYPNWCKYEYKNKLRKGRYDFYFEFNDKKYIIETDGGLGHGKKVHGKSNKTIKETKAIDDYKDKLAEKYGIEVIRIDCDESELEYIKNNILNSRLGELFDLSKIDWNKCEEFALSNLVKKVCEIKRTNPEMTTSKIGKVMSLHQTTIIRYLKKGSKLGWCNYDPKEELKKSVAKNGRSLGKEVEVLKDNKSLGIFQSATELERQSKKLFGVKLLQGEISAVSLGKKSYYKGFTFRYIQK